MFVTKLKFRKVFKWDNSYDRDALNASIWYWVNYIPASIQKESAVPRGTVDNRFNSWHN
ncbi:hypothetical protein LNO75_00460 [Mycoplasma sp. T363T]|uniref:hypothetical protein n=1 Tax=Mycoplasma bradburyae TaxID=2963128 RepID=UPI00234086FF|nr:hypothetical protein [Mycoplasma bradburyae]MDC4163053.1 hypothetical protein [Mycoplasma bradburyae]